MTDPRTADTLDEAARNADGTYDGARALSWLSDVLTGGKGVPEGEIRQMFADAKAKQGTIARDADHVDARVTNTEASINAGARRSDHRFSP
ncbi:hypothetical protein QEZ48_14700 [Aquamicrobium lusatiense]|uniref:hypothetical protein n=1 Tax=Aquamicrobium lusatiense TaxID=89772 RepID=UPI0024556F36|nr:hypothetical protein [Aquamicrobium lusatiense]MDH4992067.1 hypothetical protein [Aquamicrobium lusatiense]